MTLGDQWTDLIQIAREEELEELDRQYNTDECPWIVCAIDDNLTFLGLKLMAQE